MILVTSMLLTIYLNLSVIYMKLFHYDMALVALEDAFKINDKHSQALFRRSQVKNFKNLLKIK